MGKKGAFGVLGIVTLLSTILQWTGNSLSSEIPKILAPVTYIIPQTTITFGLSGILDTVTLGLATFFIGLNLTIALFIISAVRFNVDWWIFTEHALWLSLIGLGLYAHPVIGVVLIITMAVFRGVKATLLGLLGFIGSALVATKLTEWWNPRDFDRTLPTIKQVGQTMSAVGVFVGVTTPILNIATISQALIPALSLLVIGITFQKPEELKLENAGWIITIILAGLAIPGYLSVLLMGMSSAFHAIFYFSIALLLSITIVMFIKNPTAKGIVLSALALTVLASMIDIGTSALQFVGATAPALQTAEGSILGGMESSRTALLTIAGIPLISAVVTALFTKDKWFEDGITIEAIMLSALTLFITVGAMILIL